MLRVELLLHFLRDGQFVLQPLLLFLLLDQVLDRLRHRIEGVRQGRQLIMRLHRNAMAEVSAIDVFSGVVELGDRARHRAGQAGPDEQRQQFDDGENHCREQQRILNPGGKVTQRGEQAGVEHRRPGQDPQQRPCFFLRAGCPIHDRKRRGKGYLAVKGVACDRQRACAEVETQLFAFAARSRATLAGTERDAFVVLAPGVK